MADMLPMQKLLDAAAKEYPSLTKDELTELIGLQIEARQAEVKNEMKRAKARQLSKAKGGNIEKQMELFQDGGLKDEGGTKDPVSGNDVPPGATQEEVRDDIPAQLSEGEFVFPADVVRYIGLENLMRMRQEAKMGLKMMENMGQMGNSDEATIPDDIPFSVIDIQIAEGDDDDDDKVEKRAEGGVIEAANGFAGTTTATNPLQTRQSSMTASPTGLKTSYTAPVIPTATAAPTGGFRYKSPIDPTQKATFKGLFGGEELTQGPDEYRIYVNDAGAEIQIPFKNGKILTGFSVPEGFKLKSEKLDTAKIQSARSKTARVERETSDGSPDPTDTQTVVSLGGTIGRNGRVQGAKSFAFSVNPPANMGINALTMGQMVLGGITGSYPAGTTFNFQPLDENGKPKGGAVTNIDPKVYQAAITVTDKKGVQKTSITNPKAKDLATMLGAMENFDAGNLTYEELSNLGTTPQQIAQNIKDSQFTKEQQRKAEEITSQSIPDTPAVFEGVDETVTEGGKGTQVPGGISYVDDDPVADSTDSSSDGGGFEGTGMGGGGDDPDGPDSDSGQEDAIYKGSLITKRKASGKLKKKYMKRGGLASR
tara:strand:- start:2136 stop:3920 length:1785 start_codon:yes stop_codon:yes gene_type:complete